MEYDDLLDGNAPARDYQAYVKRLEERELRLAEKAERRDAAYELKKVRAREYARRRRKELTFVQDRAILIYKELVRLGVYPELSKEAKEFFDVYIHRDEVAQYPFPPTMYRMFDGVVGVGAQVTLRDAMARLCKGKNEINALCRGWDKKHGVHIELFPSDGETVLDNVYRITSIEPRKRGASVDDVYEILGKREAESFREMEEREEDE